MSPQMYSLTGSQACQLVMLNGKVASDNNEARVSDASTETAENQDFRKSSEIQGPLLTDHTNIGWKRKLWQSDVYHHYHPAQIVIVLD